MTVPERRAPRPAASRLPVSRLGLSRLPTAARTRRQSPVGRRRDQPVGPGSIGLEPFGAGPGREAGHAQHRRLDLQAAGIRDDQRRTIDQADGLEIAQSGRAVARRVASAPRPNSWIRRRVRGWTRKSTGSDAARSTQAREDAAQCRIIDRRCRRDERSPRRIFLRTRPSSPACRGCWRGCGAQAACRPSRCRRARCATTALPPAPGCDRPTRLASGRVGQLVREHAVDLFRHGPVEAAHPRLDVGHAHHPLLARPGQRPA